MASSRSPSARPPFSGGFDVGTMDDLARRGAYEAALMDGAAVGILGETQSKKKRQGSSDNNDKAKKKKKPRQKAAAVARTLRRDGVVQLDGLLAAATAAALRAEILQRREEAYAAVAEDGGSSEEWRKYFADVLLKGDANQRCDLLLPLKGWPGLQRALHEMLAASNHLLSSTLVAALGGDDGTLYELAALISEPGSARQPVHPDNPYQDHPPLLTTFVALQDISAEMGPTTFVPGSHTAAIHARYDDVLTGEGRDALLGECPSAVALLRAGDAALFDSRCLHCGGANSATDGDGDGDGTRVILYVSFRNPRATEPIGNVGSMREDIPRMDLAELRSKLAAAVDSDDDDGVDPFDDELEERQLRLAAEGGDAGAQLRLGVQCYLGEGGGEEVHLDLAAAVRWFELAAAQGLAQAQFNAGACYSTGEGLPERDVAKSAEFFRLAAEQNHPGAKEAYDEARRELGVP